MITIKQNLNFSNWLNINFFGELIDNAKNASEAMKIAKKIQKEEKLKGNRVIIHSYVN